MFLFFFSVTHSQARTSIVCTNQNHRVSTHHQFVSSQSAQLAQLVHTLTAPIALPNCCWPFPSSVLDIKAVLFVSIFLFNFYRNLKQIP
ncbi:hypothetical protein F4774DRAFT_387606 [Daldinia eschscholtzii]|nr:hypothetical protein F4774DRAFT_387606 [Daldinia eschscholtzii]